MRAVVRAYRRARVLTRMHVRRCLHACLRRCLHARAPTCLRAHTHTRTHACMHAWTRGCKHDWMHKSARRLSVRMGVIAGTGASRKWRRVRIPNDCVLSPSPSPPPAIASPPLPRPTPCIGDSTRPKGQRPWPMPSDPIPPSFPSSVAVTHHPSPITHHPLPFALGHLLSLPFIPSASFAALSHLPLPRTVDHPMVGRSDGRMVGLSDGRIAGPFRAPSRESNPGPNRISVQLRVPVGVPGRCRVRVWVQRQNCAKCKCMRQAQCNPEVRTPLDRHRS
jgi:hypothetical protein